MCLSVVHNRYIQRVRPRVGYKFFRKKESRGEISYHNIIVHTLTPQYINRWYFSHNPEKVVQSKYTAGFHIFRTLNDAKKSSITKKGLVLCKVKYLYPTADGIDRGGKCIVAQAMCIVQEVQSY